MGNCQGEEARLPTEEAYNVAVPERSEPHVPLKRVHRGSFHQPETLEEMVTRLAKENEVKDKEIQSLKTKLTSYQSQTNSDSGSLEPKKKYMKNGDIYEGDMIDGIFHGYGVYTWDDGDVYEGLWDHGKKEGHGIFKWKDGRTFEGEWQNDLACGHGVCIWPSGDRYEGDWVHGKRHGKGKASWSDGSHYEGAWRKGKKHGYGKLVKADGKVKEGVWDANCFLGGN